MSTTYNNLDEFLAGRGFDTFWQWGRALYKFSFGPWVQANVRMLDESELERDEDGWVLPQQEAVRDSFTVYYESERADEKWWHCRCISVTVGSIIEGASYDATPFTLAFPFTDEQFEKHLGELETEVSQEWEKVNSTYYSIRERSGHVVLWCQWVSGDEEPRGSFVEDDKAALKLAKLAGGRIFEADSWSDGNQWQIPDYPELFVRVEPQPEY